LPFDTPRRDRAHAGLRDQLDAHVREAVGVLQVVDQLRQIFDRVDVVVRRRGGQTDTRRRIPRLRDDPIDLVTRQLTALARLGPLRDLDLQLVGVDEVGARHAEPTGRDLLDRAAPRIAVGILLPALGIFAALARIAASADPVHRDRERLVGLGRDRAVGHGTGAEAAHDVLGRLDLLERHRIAVELELEQATQRPHANGVVVRRLRVLLEALEALLAHGVLELRDRLGVERVLLAAEPPLIEAAGVELGILERRIREAALVTHRDLLRDDVEADARDPRVGPDEGEIDHLAMQTDRLEDLGASR
jgi:hypothetical protein